jgi:hypothetical protein
LRTGDKKARKEERGERRRGDRREEERGERREEERGDRREEERGERRGFWIQTFPDKKGRIPWASITFRNPKPLIIAISSCWPAVEKGARKRKGRRGENRRAERREEGGEKRTGEQRGGRREERGEKAMRDAL